VPPGLMAVIFPFCDPEELQNMNIGSLTTGAEGYEVYRIALAPGADN